MCNNINVKVIIILIMWKLLLICNENDININV